MTAIVELWGGPSDGEVWELTGFPPHLEIVMTTTICPSSSRVEPSSSRVDPDYKVGVYRRTNILRRRRTLYRWIGVL